MLKRIINSAKIAAKIMFVAAAAMLLFSCNEKKSGGRTTITASFYPLYIMLMNICEGADVDISMLAPSDTGCLHDYQLTTKDMQAIEKSDIVVVNGLGMEDFIDKVFETKKDKTIVAGKDFVVTDDNPHIWVSISGAIYEVNAISMALCELDGKNAEIYAKNAEKYIAKLQNLQDEMHEKLEPFKGAKIITFHEAFPYFAAEFSLEIASVIEREPGTTPNPKELSETIETIKSENEKTGKEIPLFAEPQYSSSSAEIIARETKSRIYELDPCVTGKSDKDAYINAMKKNLETLLTALK